MGANPVIDGTAEASAELEVARYVECVFEQNDIVEVRCLRKAGIKPDVNQGWHVASSLGTRIGPLTKLNNDGWNVYVGANPRPRKGATTDSCIQIARCLFADFDGGCTLPEARQRWEAAGLPEPTLVLQSGHGIHVYWRMVEPLTDLRVWSQLQRLLIAALNSDTSIHNPERIMRLPGFLNVKCEPSVRCHVIDADAKRTYSLDGLRTVLERYGAITIRQTTEVRETQVGSLSEGVIADGERNKTLTSRAGIMRRAGMGEREILAALEAINRERCRPALPDAEVQQIAKSVGRYAPTEKKKPKKSTAPLEAYRPFPAEVLPDVVRRFVEEASTAIGCDPSFIALPTLGCLARAIGNKRVIRLKRSWDEPAIIWAVIVGKSGTHKSPAIKASMATLQRKQAEAIDRYEEAMARHTEQVAEYEREFSQWKRSKSTEKPPWEPPEPVCERFIVSDVTIEALAVLLDVQFDGLLLVRDELAGWINGIAEYKGGKGSDTGHWLATWSAEPFTVDRKTGAKKMIHVRRGAVSIVGGIQPGILRQAIGREHMQDGLCARLLVTMPEPKPVRWNDNVVRPATYEAIAVLLDQLLAMEPAADPEGKPEPFPLPLTACAREEWIAYYDRHRAEQVDFGDELSAAWSKLEAYTARFALIFELCRNPSAIAVDEQSVKDGIALSEWFGHEARRVYGMLAEDDEDRERRAMVEFIRRKGGQVTIRDLMRGGLCFPSSDEAEAALNRLAESGDGAWQFDNATGGRSRSVFQLNEAADTDRSPLNLGNGDPCVSVSDDNEVDEWMG